MKYESLHHQLGETTRAVADSGQDSGSLLCLMYRLEALLDCAAEWTRFQYTM
jgi:hypothetical protein